MSTANSKLKIDYGFDSYGTSNVEGDFRVSGNVFIGGSFLSSIVAAGDFIPLSTGSSLGNTANRWAVLATTGNFANTITVSGSASFSDTLTVTKNISVGNAEILGYANVVTSVNSAIFTIGSTFVANTTGMYHTGLVNASSFNTSGFIANTTAIIPSSNGVLLGNSLGRFVVSATSGDFSGAVSVTGNTLISGNVTVTGSLHTISGNVSFDSGVLFVDSINNRIGVGIINPGVGLDVSGSANISTSVNSALLTVGTSFRANTTGVYHTGTVNAASHTVGSNFIANSIAIVSTGLANLTSDTSTLRIGNSTVNSFINSTAVSLSSGSFSNIVNVGSNVQINTSSLLIGNGTINSVFTSSAIRITNSVSSANITPIDISIGSFVANTSTLTVNNGNFVIGANIGANVNLTTTSFQIGNSTANLNANSVLISISDSTSTANLSADDLTIGSAIVNSSVLTISTGNFSIGANVGANVKLSTSELRIGNSTVNTFVNSTAISTNTGNFSLGANVGANVRLTTVILSIGNSTVNSTVNSTTVSTANIIGTNFIGSGFANLATSVNSALFTVGTNFRANSIGVYHTGVVNSESFTIGSNFIANTVGVYHTGLVNALSYNVGSFFEANSSGAYGESFNISSNFVANTLGVYHTGIVNASSHTAGANFNANTTGVYHTGLVNAASFTIGASLTANTTGVYHTGLVNAASFTTAGFVANTTAIIPTSNTILLGNGTGRFVISANTGNFTGTVTGTVANMSTSVNSALLTVGTSFIANTTVTQVPSLGVGTAASGAAGEIRATNNITAFYSSDIKFKENIQPIENALLKVCSIGGKTFDWTDEYITSHGGEDGYFTIKSDFGVIAQDVQSVFPVAVRVRSDNTLAVDYEKLPSLAFAAIIELKNEVDNLKKQISEMKNGNSK